MSKPSTLARQIRQARKEFAALPKEVRRALLADLEALRMVAAIIKAVRSV